MSFFSLSWIKPADCGPATALGITEIWIYADEPKFTESHPRRDIQNCRYTNGQKKHFFLKITTIDTTYSGLCTVGYVMSFGVESIVHGIRDFDR